MRRSPGFAVLTGALVIVVVATPPSSVILEITSMGVLVSEPLITSTDMS